MDSDSDDSIIVQPTAARRHVVIDDDSASIDEDTSSITAKHVEILDMNLVSRPLMAAAQRNNDDLFSEDSGSLDEMLNMLSLKKDTQELVDSRHNMATTESQEDDATDEEEEDDDDDGNAHASSNPDSAWSFSKQDQEYFLSKQKTNVAWPNLRLPKLLFESLFEHQKVGVQWMAQLHVSGIGGVLADSMGLGKTYVTAAFLGGLMRTRTIKNAVIVAPMSVLRSWEKELKRVVLKCVANAEIRVLESSRSDQQRSSILSAALHCSPKRPNIIVTTYGMVNSAKALFQGDSAHWDYVVLDEAHTVKNSKTQTSLACRSLARNPKTHRLMLTGTPLMNKPLELYVSRAPSYELIG
jgi:SNF2 family DNA or RNA helicase